MPERRYELGRAERERLVAELRAKGWSLSQIGARVGMSRGGVSRVLDRLEGTEQEDW